MDKGITDANNMGAAMAPAAWDTIRTHLQDTGRTPADYDLIITGDLGDCGSRLLLELARQDGVDLGRNHSDCGLRHLRPQAPGRAQRGSGCGCCASVLTGYLVQGLRRGAWQRILFCPTGALHSPTSALQGESIPGICHAVVLTAQRPSS